MLQRPARIAGATGQDGVLLSGHLLRKGYVVCGGRRQKLSFIAGGVNQLFQNAMKTIPARSSRDAFYQSSSFEPYGEILKGDDRDDRQLSQSQRRMKA